MADNPIYTDCAVCGKQIRMTKMPGTVLDRIPTVSLQTETLACGIERTFYLCPHCGFKYTVILTDEETRELMKRRDKLKGYAGIKNRGAMEQREKEYKVLDKEVKEKLNKLNGK